MTTQAALTLVGKKSVKLPDIITTALAVQDHAVVPPEEYDIPKPVLVDTSTEMALQATAALVPLTVVERRTLVQAEIDQLNEERTQLDAMAKYIEARKAAHRAMIFNHLDVALESSLDEDTSPPSSDDKGHYIQAGEVFSSGGHRFTRELRREAPVLTAEALRAVEESLPDDVFSHDDYLAVTTQVRVLDEEKALILMRTKPEIIQAFAAAATPGKTSASLYRRK